MGLKREGTPPSMPSTSAVAFCQYLRPSSLLIKLSGLASFPFGGIVSANLLRTPDFFFLFFFFF